MIFNNHFSLALSPFLLAVAALAETMSVRKYLADPKFDLIFIAALTRQRLHVLHQLTFVLSIAHQARPSFSFQISIGHLLQLFCFMFWYDLNTEVFSNLD
jgi:hypothetical protein